MAIEIDYYITMVSKIMSLVNTKREFLKLFRARVVWQGKEFVRRKSRPKFAKRNQRSKWKIPPQTPPFPFATSKFKNK